MTGCQLAAGCRGLGFDWGAFISEQVGSWSKTGQDILRSESLPRGVYTQTGPGGTTTTYVQPAGTSQNVFGATGASATASPGIGLVVIGGAALLLVFMLAKR